jgi:putative pyruvate formate lyase activating enzyme
MIKSKPLIFDGDLIKQGVIVRHLVLPQASSDSKKILDWFAPLKDKAHLSVMSQYTPFGEIENFPELKRPITKGEYDRVINALIDAKIENCLIQERESSSTSFIPKWDF